MLLIFSWLQFAEATGRAQLSGELIPNFFFFQPAGILVHVELSYLFSAWTVMENDSQNRQTYSYPVRRRYFKFLMESE